MSETCSKLAFPFLPLDLRSVWTFRALLGSRNLRLVLRCCGASWGMFGLGLSGAFVCGIYVCA